MVSGNDNFPSEQEFLLSKAAEMVDACKPTADHISCSLIHGGFCPLLGSAMHSFKEMNKERKL